LTELTKRSAWLDTLLLLVLATVLVFPLFRLEYLNNWPSIESTFIADARMLADRLPHPGWQPMWYCGTRFDYIYPPALRYGTALIAKFANVSTARAYHLFSGAFYIIGIAGVYWMVRIGKRSRWAAILAAVWVAVLSPSFLLLPNVRHDSGYWVPQRLHVLMAWGEGPHISALSVLGVALAVTFIALRGGSRIALAAAASLCALTVAINFYGATSLAIFFPIVAWSVWVGRPEPAVWLRALGIAALAYGLSAFWLTPSYLRITTANLRLVSLPGSNGARLAMMAVAAVFCAVTWRWARRRPDRAWTVFVAGAALIVTVYVIGFIDFGFRVLGDAQRLIPELDMVLILAFLEILWILWNRRAVRLLVVAAALFASFPAIRYLRHAYYPFPKAEHVENQYEYRIGQWVHDNLPGERVLPSGTVRFWFDAWFDNAQLDGGSAQGMLNQILPDAEWQIPVGDRGEIAVLWMQALGTDAVIVPDRTSFEPYHDYHKPEKFRGVVPVLYDDQHGTVIYRIPRRYPGIGRVVEAGQLSAIGRINGGEDVGRLTRYVAAVDSPGQSPTPVQWKSFDEVDIQAQVPSGRSVLLQETYDPAWHAYENGRPLAIRPEPVMSFILIDVPAGNHTIQLLFETPLENRIGQMVSGLALLVVAWLIFRRPKIS
jgi:hypothetical protein